MEDVREYEEKMQKATNSIVLDGVDLTDNTVPPSSSSAATAAASS